MISRASLLMVTWKVVDHLTLVRSRSVFSLKNAPTPKARPHVRILLREVLAASSTSLLFLLDHFPPPAVQQAAHKFTCERFHCHDLLCQTCPRRTMAQPGVVQLACKNWGYPFCAGSDNGFIVRQVRFALCKRQYSRKLQLTSSTLSRPLLRQCEFRLLSKPFLLLSNSLLCQHGYKTLPSEAFAVSFLPTLQRQTRSPSCSLEHILQTIKRAPSTANHLLPPTATPNPHSSHGADQTNAVQGLRPPQEASTHHQRQRRQRSAEKDIDPSPRAQRLDSSARNQSLSKELSKTDQEAHHDSIPDCCKPASLREGRDVLCALRSVCRRSRMQLQVLFGVQKGQ